MTAMKRFILILWITLVSGGWLMANHWIPNSTSYENNMTLTGIVRIDGVEQQTTALEVGAFCDEECRGSARLAFFPPTQRYVVQVLIYGNLGDQITFRLYDHEQNMELDLISENTVTFTSDGYGSLANPYMLNFYSAPPGPHAITVSANPEVGGTVTGGGTYNHGATVTLTASANEDYRFVNWTKDGEVVSNRATFSFVVIEAGNYVANFELSITHHWVPNSMSYESNMTPMLEVGVFCGEECRGSGIPTYFEPMQRYIVQILIYGESGDPLTFQLYDHEFNEELELYPTHAVTFTPNGCGSLANPHVLNFIETPTTIHEITATVNPEEAGTIMGTGDYLNGTTCTLLAEANDNYQFVNWTENGAMVSTSSSYAFEVTSNRSLVANFVPIEGNHWTPNTAPYENNMTLTGIVQINSVEQQTTAIEVGAFCGEECRGTGRLTFCPPTQHYVIQLVIYGNEGNQLTFKLFDHAIGQELDLTSPEAITFNDNGYGSLQEPYILNFLQAIIQTVSFSQGTNWFSTYLEITLADLQTALTDVLGTGNNVSITIKSKNQNSKFTRGRWTGQLQALDLGYMYKITVNSDCDITLEGMLVDPADHPVTIPGQGQAVWIAFPFNANMTLTDAFAGFAVNGDVLKAKNGNANYTRGRWAGQLQTLEPGQGYIYKSSTSAGDRILIFPSSKK